jgi:cephalosporin hydroxylase
VEVSLKAWLSGGALMVNKKTWFAHWFRGDEGFPYPLTSKEISAARQYSRDLWLKDQWPGQVRKLEWLVEKFNPPGWEGYMQIDEEKRMEMNSYMYRHIHLKNKDIRYKGIQTMKMPTDMTLYHNVIWENKPQVIVEIGTAFGGSSLFFQDQLDLVGEGGRVITIDVQNRVAKHDPRITYLMGDAKADAMVAQVKELTAGKTVMVIVDGDHRRVQVKWELKKYSQIVTAGQYLVVEDCFARDGDLYQPGQARDWFLSVDKNFIQTNLDHKFLVGMCIGGWLRRK